MPRPPRIWLPNHFYHVVSRGNRRDPLFRSATDYEAFFHILHQVYEKYPFEIACYCLMTNHFHLQIRSKEAPLSKIMALINKRYANYYNTRYKLSGHVYEKRFYDKVIEDRKGMIDVSRYIHLNPLEANMVKKPERYQWSSYLLFYYSIPSPYPFINIHGLLDLFAGTEQQKRTIYCELIGKTEKVRTE
ncbi:MAG: transposase [Bacillus sp. (in: firmicutes)]